MIKLLMGALLVSTITLAQTTPKTNQSQSPTGQPKSDATAKPTKAAAARSTKPIPNPSLNANQQSGDNAIPSYRMAKDAGRGRAINRQFKPSRTASGARKDTMDQKRP